MTQITECPESEHIVLSGPRTRIRLIRASRASSRAHRRIAAWRSYSVAGCIMRARTRASSVRVFQA